jgi:hypothetical protein
MNSGRSLYDELRELSQRKARASYSRPYFTNRATITGAFAQPFNPFERAVLRRKTEQRRAKLRLAFGR